MLSSKLPESGCAAMMRESTRIPYVIATCALLAGVVLDGCADRPRTQSAPAQAVPPAAPATPQPSSPAAPTPSSTPTTPAVPTPPATSAVPARPAAPATPAAPTAQTPGAASPPTASEPNGSVAPKPTAPPVSKGQPTTPPKTGSTPPKPAAPSATSPAPNGTPAPPSAASTAAAPKPAAQPAAAPTAPALDLTSLEQRLRDTKAIGVFTKLSLKNQVDDLLGQFRTFHKQQSTSALPALRQKYDLLLLKVLSLLQDGDPPLAAAISSSREAIWGILTDPVKFAKI